MAIETSGAISLGTTAGTNRSISAEFGGTTPHSLSEYYGVDSVPGSGAISFSDFYGTSSAPVPAYTSIDRSVTEVDEDGSSVCTFTINAVALTSGTTVGWNVASALTSASNNDFELSLDNSNWSAGADSGTLTLDFAAQNFKLYFRAVEDNTTESGPENWAFELDATDSNGVSTGGLSKGVSINDTSLDPLTFPAGIDIARQFDGTFNSVSQDVSTYAAYLTKSSGAGEPEANAFFNFRRTSTGWDIRVASGLFHTMQNYNTSGVLVNSPTPGTAGLDYIPWVAQAGTLQPDAIMWTKTLVQTSETGALITFGSYSDNVGALGNQLPINGTYAVNPGVWQTVALGESVQFTHFGSGDFDPGDNAGIGGFDSLYKIEFWARKSGYDDTLVATYLSRIVGRDSHSGSGGGGGELP
jgi:hypothetical protein